MKEDVILSIIIPAYNAEEYIEKCIKSVSTLDLESCEVIVIDDGSDDKTPQIIKELEKKYRSVFGIFNNHSGRQKARRTGISKSHGKYLTFLDSDDWVDDGFYEKIVNELENNSEIDVGIGSIYRNYCDGTEYPYHNLADSRIMDKDTAIDAMLKGDGFKWELCAKVYKKESLNIDFPEGDMQVCEDLDWNWRIFSNIKKVLYISEIKYHYYMNPHSTTQMMTKDKMTQHIVYKRILDNIGEEQQYYQFFLKAYAKMFPRLILETFMEVTSNPKTEVTEYQAEFRWALRKLKENVFDSDMKHAIESNYDACEQFFKNQIIKIRTDIEELEKKYKYIYLYGTGFVAAFISRWNDFFNLNITGYAVSDGQPNQKLFFEKPVSYVSEIKSDKEDTCFILSLVKKVQTPVKKYLLENGYNNYYLMNTAPFADG